MIFKRLCNTTSSISGSCQQAQLHAGREPGAKGIAYVIFALQANEVSLAFQHATTPSRVDHSLLPFGDEKFCASALPNSSLVLSAKMDNLWRSLQRSNRHVCGLQTIECFPRY